MENELRLSKSFVECPKDCEPSVELVVKVININLNKNHPILGKCPILREYMQFVEQVRKYVEEGEEYPVTKAVRVCIEQGILAEYLKERGSEVENMLIAEYNYEEDIAVQREEAYEDGVLDGIQKGMEEAISAFVSDYLEEGFSKERIMDKLMKKFDLTQEQAEGYFKDEV